MRFAIPKNRDNAILAMVLIGCMLVVAGVLGYWLWPYTFNSWLVFAGKVPKVQGWHGFLLGIFPPTGGIMIPVAVITWILMIVLN